MTVKRIKFLQELLAFLGLAERLHLSWISSAEAQKFVRVATDFTEKIRKLGPNPLPGCTAAWHAAEMTTTLLSEDTTLQTLKEAPMRHETQP